MVDDLVRPCQFLKRDTLKFALPLDAVNGDLASIEYLGGGSFGNAIKVPKYLYKGKYYEVAVKKLYEPLRDEKNALNVYRELRLLQMTEHENVVKLIDLYTPDTSPENLRSVYIVTEYAGVSLEAILKRQRETGCKQLGPLHHKFIIYQLLRALKYIHSANIIHRDLKPSNLALTRDCDLTVLDFGQARTMNRSGDGYTHYVMTRWYRSPEVMFWRIGAYDQQVDMWSVGCILAELILGDPIFRADDPFLQYDSISRVCGSPDDILMAKIKDNEAVVNVLKHYDHRDRRSFSEIFSDSSPELIDFLDRVLVLDPERRMNVSEGLAHPYLREYSDPEDEPEATGPFVIGYDDDQKRSMWQWRKIIWPELQQFNPLRSYDGMDVTPS